VSTVVDGWAEYSMWTGERGGAHVGRHPGSTRRSAPAALGHKREAETPMTFHDLRHTFGTLAVKVWDLPKVQGYMGHANISTTMGYVHHVPKTSDANALTALVDAGDRGAIR